MVSYAIKQCIIRGCICQLIDPYYFRTGKSDGFLSYKSGGGGIMALFLLESVFAKLILLALHLNTQSVFPEPLSKKEEERLLKLKDCGDAAARNKLIEHNLRLVAHVIKKYYASSTQQDDLISVGTVGLIKGIDSFDVKKGARLATYAARCIENEILMFFRNQKKMAQDVSMSEPIETDSEGNPLTLSDIISVEDTIADDIDRNIKRTQLRRLLESVTDARERKIIELRYGLDGSEPLAQREVAEMLSISRSYVSRIEKRALARLRKLIENENITFIN